MPETYWRPWLGLYALRPADLADLTPQQMDACWDFHESRGV